MARRRNARAEKINKTQKKGGPSEEQEGALANYGHGTTGSAIGSFADSAMYSAAQGVAATGLVIRRRRGRR